MHSRWETWSKVWFPNGLISPVIVGAALTGQVLTSSASHPILQSTLFCASLLGVSASSVAWAKRGRKEWTLPHDSWKDACAKVEQKLQRIVHQPHLYRVSALSDLSSVLKDAELERIGTARQKVRKEDMSEHDANTYVGVWKNDYTVGNIAAALLTPDVLNKVHLHFGFNQSDVEQWVEASYLHRIYQDLKSPLSGTIASLVHLANDNPATMAFHLQSYPTYIDQKNMFNNNCPVKWADASASTWLSKTQWPSVVTLLYDMQENTPKHKTGGTLSAMELYRQVMRGKQAQTEPTFDGGLFEMVP